MRFIEARTPHEARPLKIAHGSDALCRDAQLSRTPPSDRRVCGAAPLVLGRLRLLADRGSVPDKSSPADRVCRDSVAGLFGSGEANSPEPGSDSTEPGSELDGAGQRTRRTREANSTEPGGELDGAGRRTRRIRRADSVCPGGELDRAGKAKLVVPARSASRPPCAPTPRSKRPPPSRAPRRPAKHAISPRPGWAWHVVHVGRAPCHGLGIALDWPLLQVAARVRLPPHPPPATPTHRPLLPALPLLPPLPPSRPPAPPAGKFHHSSDASPGIPDFSPATGVIRR